MELVKGSKGRMRQTLGLALIVKNEENEIKQCIEACKGVDQISVVDTGSHDKTVDILREMGIKRLSVGEFNWPAPPDYTGVDFSAARNKSFDLLNTDWILFMDADERPDKGAIAALKYAIDTVAPEIDVVNCVLYDNCGGKFPREKAFRNNSNMYFAGRIHEARYTPYAAFTPSPPIMIQYQPRPNTARDLAILREELAADPNDLRLQYLAVREYFAVVDLPSAIYWGERFRRNSRKLGKFTQHYPDALHSTAWAYLNMAGAGQTTEIERAKELLLECLGFNADFKEAAKMLSAICGSEGNVLNQQRWQEFSEGAANRGLPFLKKDKAY